MSTTDVVDTLEDVVDTLSGMDAPAGAGFNADAYLQQSKALTDAIAQQANDVADIKARFAKYETEVRPLMEKTSKLVCRRDLKDSGATKKAFIVMQAITIASIVVAAILVILIVTYVPKSGLAGFELPLAIGVAFMCYT